MEQHYSGVSHYYSLLVPQTAHEGTLKEAWTSFLDLCRATEPDEENSVAKAGRRFLLARWLFGRPEWRPHARMRQALCSALKDLPECEVLQFDGYVFAVSLDFDQVRWGY